MAEVIIEAQNLYKSYRAQEKQVDVIRNLTISFKKGEFAAVMGSSGSGKSSLLYLLGGLDHASKGEIDVCGASMPDMSEHQRSVFRRKKIGFVFQDRNLASNLTLLENVFLPGLLLKNNRREVRQRACALMEQVGISHLMDRFPAQVSGGEQQRCAIARALINQPAVLLADEPTGNLHSAATDTILDLFSQLHQQGQTVVLVTHELGAACRGDRVCYLLDGEISGELRFDPQTQAGKSQREDALYRWLTGKGW